MSKAILFLICAVVLQLIISIVYQFREPESVIVNTGGGRIPGNTGTIAQTDTIYIVKP